MKRSILPLLSSLCFTLALSADAPPSAPFKQGEILPEGRYPAAYNAPSQVRLQNNEGKWLPDLFVDASFIYYYANEGGLDLGTSAALVSTMGGAVVAATSDAKILFQEFEYKPGFKVGIGTRFPDWTLWGEYTWIRQTTHTHKEAPDPDIAGASGVWVLDDWFEQLTPSGQFMAASDISSKWRLAIDLADLALSRPFYEGRNLSIVPSFGVRAAWIRQKINVGIEIPAELIANQTSEMTFSRNLSHSWAIGPRAALEMDCLLGMGFRLQGEIATSLLFTQYTRVQHKENVASASGIPPTLGVGYRNYNSMKPIGELGLGFGWGSYLCMQKYHIDFSATYDFLWFWNQNMIRKLLDTTISGAGGAASNLSLHGLTLTARFDF